MSNPDYLKSPGNQFTLGSEAAERISAVEGVVRSERTDRLQAESAREGETGDMRRARILAEFSK